MYEQDYIIRMNNEVIRTMVKLLLNKDIGTPVDISDGAIKGENRKILEAANGQSGIDNIKKMEEEILTLVDVNKEGALEKALVFYGYLNELPEDELLSGNYSHEKIKKGLNIDKKVPFSKFCITVMESRRRSNGPVKVVFLREKAYNKGSNSEVTNGRQ